MHSSLLIVENPAFLPMTMSMKTHMIVNTDHLWSTSKAPGTAFKNFHVILYFLPIAFLR